MQSSFRRLLAAACLSMSAFGAQAQTFPNGGMETWTNYSAGLLPVALEKPNNWHGSDSLAAIYLPALNGFQAAKKQLFKSTDSHSGTYAALLLSRDQVITELPCLLSNGRMAFKPADTSFNIYGGQPETARPDSAIAWIKYIPADDIDAGVFQAEAVRIGEGSGGADSVIGAGYALIDASTEYGRMAIPIEYINTTQMPTHFRVTFASSADLFNATDSSKLFVDDVSYKIGSTSVSLMNFEQQDVKVFPNPAKDVLNLRATVNGTLHFEAYNVAGQRMATQDFSGNATVSLKGLPAGLYAYRILGDEGTVQQGTFCVE